MTDQELLPCPFCGNEAVGYDSEDVGDYGTYLEFNIRCSSQNCILWDRLSCERIEKQEFISKWNSRYRQRVHKLNQL